MDLSNFDEVIKFAIDREEEAVKFYERLAKKAKNPAMKDVFIEWSNEERKHKNMLENLHIKGEDSVKIVNVPNLKIADYMVEIKEKPDMNYAEFLMVAMKREEKSYQLYSEFAEGVTDVSLKKTFEILKAEELKHKLRLESEYDEYVLKDN